MSLIISQVILEGSYDELNQIVYPKSKNMDEKISQGHDFLPRQILLTYFFYLFFSIIFALVFRSDK